MRISDWSSDVCSSDLQLAHGRKASRGGEAEFGDPIAREGVAQREFGAECRLRARGVKSGGVSGPCPARQPAIIRAPPILPGAQREQRPRPEMERNFDEPPDRDRKKTRLNSSN